MVAEIKRIVKESEILKYVGDDSTHCSVYELTRA